MKKILYLVLISIISLGLIACGSNTDVTENIETTDVAEIEVNTNEDTIAEEVIEMEEPTSEINEEAVEEVIEEAEDTLVEEKVEEIVEENVSDETETTTYTYSDTSATMYAKSTVNVRDLPDQSGNKVGSLSQNQEVTVTGKCNETGWYRIDYNGSVAYVSNSFLVNEKVEVAPPAETNTPVNNNPPANNGGGQAGTGQYPYYTWIDKDFYFVWYGQSQDDIATKFNFADTDIYCNILKERYPGYPDATAGGISDGKYAPVTYICFLYNDELKQTYPVDVINTYER